MTGNISGRRVRGRPKEMILAGLRPWPLNWSGNTRDQDQRKDMGACDFGKSYDDFWCSQIIIKIYVQYFWHSKFLLQFCFSPYACNLYNDKIETLCQTFLLCKLNYFEIITDEAMFDILGCPQVLVLLKKSSHLLAQQHAIHPQPLVPPLPLHHRLCSPWHAAFWRRVSTVCFSLFAFNDRLYLKSMFSCC